MGDDLRVVARLVEAEGGAIKVQESLTDRFANLLQMQDNLAHRFAGALQDSPAAATRVPTASLTAYRAVAEANTLYLATQYREAIQRLETAVAQDEEYADAWALLGKSYARLAEQSISGVARERRAVAVSAAGAARRATCNRIGPIALRSAGVASVGAPGDGKHRTVAHRRTEGD